jgi:hypothetical protein
MFIPQVILAILASSLGPRLARRWALKNIPLSGLAADLLALLLLACSHRLQDSPGAAKHVHASAMRVEARSSIFSNRLSMRRPRFSIS